MKINVDIDAGLLANIELAAKVQGVSREAAFKEALETWIAYKPKSTEWSMDYSKLEFDPDFIPFETDRPGPEAFSTSGSRR